MHLRNREKCTQCECSMRWHTLLGNCSLCDIQHARVALPDSPTAQVDDVIDRRDPDKPDLPFIQRRAKD
jgi:hypothetical protein